MAVLPWASLAITVYNKTLPAVVVLGALIAKCVAGALTVMGAVLPVTVMAAASKTEIVWLPKVFQGCAEGAGATGEVGVDWQKGAFICAGKPQRCRIGGGVVEGVFGGDGEGERGCRRDDAGRR